MLGSALKLGLAKKAFDEARKPHNQRKIKDLVGSLTGKGGSSRGGRGTTPR